MKIANGCNATEIFPGLFHNCLVAVKRVAKHISQKSWKWLITCVQTVQLYKQSIFLFALQDGIGKFKGKSLEEITPNINSEQDLSDSDAEEVQSEQTATPSQEGNSEGGHSDHRAATSKKKTGVIKNSNQKEKPRRPWSQSERKIVEHHFKDFLEEMKLPGKVDCQRCLNENQTLRDNGRDWKTIKYFLHNKIVYIKKNVCQER
ncbi:uncharacterized protein LOC116067062 [Sander lucioperca]|uniref:uncharacterized protein LOC116067062 n=1 Tax=Sander lucioperca TaxID=283035 RepID=UPI00165361EB|nr:uncharacterized protein LOC116067062 [Sander lucioperca]